MLRNRNLTQRLRPETVTCYNNTPGFKQTQNKQSTKPNLNISSLLAFPSPPMLRPYKRCTSLDRGGGHRICSEHTLLPCCGNKQALFFAATTVIIHRPQQHADLKRWKHPRCRSPWLGNTRQTKQCSEAVAYTHATSIFHDMGTALLSGLKLQIHVYLSPFSGSSTNRPGRCLLSERKTPALSNLVLRGENPMGVLAPYTPK